MTAVASQRLSLLAVGWWMAVLCLPAPAQQPEADAPAQAGSRHTKLTVLDLSHQEAEFLRVEGHGCLPLRLRVVEEGNAPKWRRLQVFVAVYLPKLMALGSPDALLTTWKCPDFLVAPPGQPGTAEINHDLPLPAGNYPFEVYLCDPDEPFEAGGFPRQLYHPEPEEYPGKVLRMQKCRVTVN